MTNKKESIAAFGIVSRRQQVAANRLGGLTVREIAEALGVSKSTVGNDLKALHREWYAAAGEDTAQHKTLTLRRLEVLLNAVWSRAVSGNLAAVDKALKLIEAESKLMGLDAPVKIEDVSPERTDRIELELFLKNMSADAAEAFDNFLKIVEQEQQQQEMPPAA